MLELLQPRANFEPVGEEDIDGRHVRHLRARTPQAMSKIVFGGDLSLEPDLGKLDVWVGDDNVLYRLDWERTQVGSHRAFLVDEDAPCPPGSERLEEDPIEPPVIEGRKQKICDDLATVVRTKESFSVRFHDLGAPVTFSD
jgi:hypothetical protein